MTISSQIHPKPSSSNEIVRNPFAFLEDKADPTVPTGTLQVYQYIYAYLLRTNDTHINRASSAPLCYKRRWFQRKGVKGVPIAPRNMINFLLGDLSEKVLQFYVANACVGPGKLYSEVNLGVPIGSFQFQEKEIIIYKQPDLTAMIGEIEFTAHVDGWGRRNSDGQWELIEFKSSSDYGFDSFKLVGAKDYLKQAMVNLQTNKGKELKAKQVRFFFLRKSTGHIWDRVFDFSPDIAREVEAEAQIANQDQEPKAPYRPTYKKLEGQIRSRRVATFPCTYCGYLRACHGEFETLWKVDSSGFHKPVYVFK